MTTKRARTGVDVFSGITPNTTPRKRPCDVCSVFDTVNPCRHCREDLPGLLVSLQTQQKRLQALIADGADLDARLARQALLGKLERGITAVKKALKESQNYHG